jgi:hypothetical protein
MELRRCDSNSANHTFGSLPLSLQRFALLVASDRIEIAADAAASTLPLMTTFLFLSELRSGLVLDSYWRATYPQGTWQFKLGLAARAAITILFTYFAVEFSRMK